MTVIAAWKLERSIAIGLLEYLLGSRSLGSAFLSLVKLRIFDTWIPVIISAWCLSPLGGQASLRAVSSTITYTDSLMDFHILDNNNTTPINVFASASDSYSAAINSVFVTALASSNASKYGSQDMYGNLHLPTLESITSEPAADDWYNLEEQEVPVHPALLGIPFTGVPNDANSSFSVSTSYVFCNCAVAIESFELSAAAEYVWNVTTSGPGSRSKIAAMTYGRDNATGPRLQDISPSHQRDDTASRTIGLQSRNFFLDPGTVSEAWCNLSTTYIELRAQCSRGPQNCTVTKARKAPYQPWPSIATTLDCIWGGQDCQPTFLANAFFREFMRAVPPSSHADYTALEQFFLTPGVPFLFPNSTIPIGNIGDMLFSQRLTQLLNTYLLTSSAPYAVSGDFSYSPQDEGYSTGHSIANSPLSSSPSYGIQTT